MFTLTAQVPGVHRPGGGRVKHAQVRHRTDHQAPGAGGLRAEGITQHAGGAAADCGQGLRQAQAALLAPSAARSD